MCLLAFLGAGAFGRAASGHWTCASSDVRSTPGNPCGLHLDASPVLPGTAVGRLRGQVQRNRLRLLVHFISNSTCSRQWYCHCSFSICCSMSAASFERKYHGGFFTKNPFRTS
uniref:Putative secreted protein n=1 Tax=Ixodes ricinus TaxID=34613 RepID=A0A6B0UK46_IXORI